MFEPKGERAEWHSVYSALTVLKVNDVITYEQLDRILGRDFRSARSPFNRAVEELQRQNQRTLANVRNTGYRVIEAQEHAGEALRHLRKGRRSSVRALGKAQSADRNELDPETSRRMDSMEHLIAGQVEGTKRLEKRLTRTEVRVEDHEERLSGLETFRKEDQDVTNDRLARMEEELRRFREGGK